MANLARFALALGAAGLIAGCAGAQPPNGAPGAIPQTSSGAPARAGVHHTATFSYRVVHSFRHQPRGAHPGGSLIDVNGTLYGTTRFGGGGTCYIFGGSGCGTVYQLNPNSGAKKVLYSFRGGSSDGAYPVGGLIDVNGTLYGTTEYGGGGCGNYGCGTVYSVTATGTEAMLHSFNDTSDGFNPLAGLIDVNGTLYGTTSGSRSGSCVFCGTVYSISTSGSEKILYTFAGGSDGEYPLAGLIDVKGTLYGTTDAGGSSGDGTVYSITTTGTEKVLHSFGGSPDGASPSSGLIDVKGTLYGTTPSGGDALCYEVSSTCGIVYSITTTGKEKVVYTFTPGDNYGGGAYPLAALLNMNGVLYGTAEVGGNGRGCIVGCGVVYSLTTTGQEKVLHVFNGGSDGASPNSALIDVNGSLYGTTPSGGGSSCRHSGCGIVFALTP